MKCSKELFAGSGDIWGREEFLSARAIFCASPLFVLEAVEAQREKEHGRRLALTAEQKARRIVLHCFGKKRPTLPFSLLLPSPVPLQFSPLFPSKNFFVCFFSLCIRPAYCSFFRSFLLKKESGKTLSRPGERSSERAREKKAQ